MGQYYKAMVIDEDGDIKVLCPRDYNNLPKLMEFSWCGNDYVNAVLSLIHNKRAKIAFIGDYANEPFRDSKNFYNLVMSKESYEKHYKAIWSKDQKLRLPKYRSGKTDFDLMDIDTVGMYLVNHDKCEYLDIEEYIENSKVFNFDYHCAVNPLPLLTACGNGLGGGDFYYEHIRGNDVGKWAFNILEYTDHVPENYLQASFIFKFEEAVTNGCS